MVDTSSKSVPIVSILGGPTSILVSKPSKGGKPVRSLLCQSQLKYLKNSKYLKSFKSLKRRKASKEPPAPVPALAPAPDPTFEEEVRSHNTLLWLYCCLIHFLKKTHWNGVNINNTLSFSSGVYDSINRGRQWSRREQRAGFQN